jgi:hypothetical protein
VKRFKFLSLVLAAFLQANPLDRSGKLTFMPVGCLILRLTGVLCTVTGSLHAQSGATGITTTTTIVSATSVSATVGKPFSYTVLTYPYAAGQVTWQPYFTGGELPPGLAAIPGTPFIQGTPTTPGVFYTTVYAWQFPLSQIPAASNPSTAAPLTITINSPTVAPNILRQPSDLIVNDGDSAKFEVGAQGTQLQYQWYFGSQRLAGQTSSNLTLVNVTTSQSGGYLVTVGNSLGVVLSRTAKLQVNPRSSSPLLTTEPSDVTVLVGEPARFEVGATADASLSYQWFFGTNLLNGETSPVLNFGSVASTNAGAYHATISNSGGSVSSRAAILTVVSKPSFVPPFVLAGAAITNGEVEFRFPVIAGASYVVETNGGIQSEGWGVLTNLVPQLSATNAMIRKTAEGASMMFRVLSEP